MNRKQPKTVSLGHSPRAATDLRVVTPSGDVWISWRELGPAVCQGAPATIVSVDADPDRYRYAGARVHVARAARNGVLVWVVTEPPAPPAAPAPAPAPEEPAPLPGLVPLEIVGVPTP